MQEVTEGLLAHVYGHGKIPKHGEWKTVGSYSTIPACEFCIVVPLRKRPSSTTALQSCDGTNKTAVESVHISP